MIETQEISRATEAAPVVLRDDERQRCEVWTRVVDYTTPDGVTHRNSGYKLYGLPPRTNLPNDDFKSRVDDFLATHGVVHYDPTNGLVSNGDVFRYSR